MADDDDEEAFGGAYENGHWIWDDYVSGLTFISDKPVTAVENVPVSKISTVEAGAYTFNEDVDLLEQVRFRKRYARKVKPGQPDIITLQDVKDLAIYTAPVSLLSPMLINLLHLSTTERFIRALIVYCQYYLQVEETVAQRMEELDTKVRTPNSELVEAIFRENLSDLRCLVAKEYSVLLIGGADTYKFHHMGPLKKRKSLANKDSRLFETFLRITIQIVWLALSRRSFNKIELEINRIFKTDYFNVVEHTLKTGFITKMAKEEANTLLGRCLRHEKKLVLRSPLMNEAFCDRPIDYRMLGLGVIEYPDLSPRLVYMMRAVAAPETVLMEEGVPAGILGLPRAFFDNMLRVLPTAFEATGKKKKISTGSIRTGSVSTKSMASSSKKDEGCRYIYRDVILPNKDLIPEELPDGFPDKEVPVRACSDVQRRRWQRRLCRLLNPGSGKRHSDIIA